MKLEDLKALCEKASPPPWQSHVSDTRKVYKGERPLLTFETGNDAYFAIRARSAMPLLIAIAEAAGEFSNIGAGLRQRRLNAALAALEVVP